MIVKSRNWVHKALKGISKLSSTKDILGTGIDTYRQWLDIQKTLEMNCWTIRIDHVRLISSVDVSKNEELREAFSWKNTQPLKKRVH